MPYYHHDVDCVQHRLFAEANLQHAWELEVQSNWLNKIREKQANYVLFFGPGIKSLFKQIWLSNISREAALTVWPPQKVNVCTNITLKPRRGTDLNLRGWGESYFDRAELDIPHLSYFYSQWIKCTYLQTPKRRSKDMMSPIKTQRGRSKRPAQVEKSERSL